MKRISKKQKIWAILGAGLLVAAASGSAFAMRAAEERDIRQIEVRQEKKLTTQTSPLPTPTVEPTSEPEHEVEFTGTVEVIASDMWVVGGRTVAVTAATEIKPSLAVGLLAKVQAVQRADGTLLAREIEPAESDDHGNSNSNDDNENGNVNSNDDNGNGNDANVNSNDDHGGDDHGGNANVNSNDNHDGGEHNGNSNVNSNDDHGDGKHNANGNVNSNDNHGDGGHGGHGD